MIIRKMRAGFGSLENKTMTLKSGLNIVSAPNESGKSTWCAFIRTMLYGLSTSARESKGVKPDRVRYAPWSGTPMGGSMLLEHKGEKIVLSRWTEKATAPMQAFSAEYADSGTAVPGMESQTAGELLTGVSRAVFERSAFISQSGIAVSNSAELERRINAVVTTGEEGSSCTEAENRLKAWQKTRKSGSHGAIPEIQEKLAELCRKQEKIRLATDEVMDLTDEIAALKKQKTQAIREMETARATKRKDMLQQLTSSRKKIQNLEEEKSEVEQRLQAIQKQMNQSPFAGKEPEEAQQQAAFVLKKSKRLAKAAEKTMPIWIFLSVYLLAAVLLAAGFLTDMSILLLSAGAVAFVVGVMLMIRALDMKKRAKEKIEEREELLEPYGKNGVRRSLERYEQLWELKTEAEEECSSLTQHILSSRTAQSIQDDAVVKQLDFSKGDSEASAAGRKVNELTEKINDCIQRRAVAEGKIREIGDPAEIADKVEELRSQLKEMNGQYDAIQLAVETMAEADREIQSRFSPLLSKKTAEYFSYLTEGRYNELSIAGDLSAKARLEGETVGREASSLSEGTNDQLYLALRLAVCELALPGDEPCPLILDDALVNFDEARLGRALELIYEISRKRQVILFTCQNREEEYLKEKPGVNLVSLGEGTA